jgi:coenzyme F420-reducing hydrogenase delta subunit/Pyruvate/2-oxoacid:ferredoxin oxidoreductase delta subunit
MTTRHPRTVQPNAQAKSALPKALVLGGGIPAVVAAQALREMHAEVTFARIPNTPSHDYLALSGSGTDSEVSTFAANLDDIEVMEVARAPVLRREAGGFHALFDNGMEKFYDCVLLAPGLSLKAGHVSLPRDVEVFSSHSPFRSAERVTFLLDYERPSDSALGICSIREAYEHAVKGGVSVVCFRHAPVPHLFGETIYDEARMAGVHFVRFDENPAVSVVGEDPVIFQVKTRDVIDYDRQLIFDCDRLLVVTGPDESSIPRWAMEIWGRSDLDDQGFALSENVYCNSGFSFASGVFIVGEATGDLDLIGLIAQARAAAVKAYAWMLDSRSQTEDGPLAISSACVGCLTCYRVCPHKALSLKPRLSSPIIDPLPSLCRRCGICASVCPALAVTLNTCPEDSLLTPVKEVPLPEIGRTIFVFGCERSAGLVADSIQLPAHVVFMKVPCAGRVSNYVIWNALAAGAAGVLVVGCHQGNCASDTGTNLAAARIRSAFAGGFFRGGRRRLGYVTVAANEHARFERLLREFKAEVMDEI